MNKSKKIILCILIVISALVLSFGVYVLYFYCTTQNANEIIEELNSRSENEKPNFEKLDKATVSNSESYDFNNYVFFVNNSVFENQKQEMAIYKKKHFLFTDWCRYTVNWDTVGHVPATEEPVGSLTAQIERDDGSESFVCAFYSDNNSDKNISKMNYTLYSNGDEFGTNSIEKIDDDIMVIIVDHLGEETIGQYISLSSAKFYDSKDNLIFDYIH